MKIWSRISILLTPVMRKNPVAIVKGNTLEVIKFKDIHLEFTSIDSPGITISGFYMEHIFLCWHKIS